jgi:hypothetical protein
MVWRFKEEMAVEDCDVPILASRTKALWDLRDVPLGRLSDNVEAMQLVDCVMASAEGPSLVVVAGFNSAV